MVKRRFALISRRMAGVDLVRCVDFPIRPKSSPSRIGTETQTIGPISYHRLSKKQNPALLISLGTPEFSDPFLVELSLLVPIEFLSKCMEENVKIKGQEVGRRCRNISSQGIRKSKGS